MAEVDLLYFGALREALGRERERVDPPSHVLTIDDLIAWLAERGDPYAPALGGAEIGAAVEGHMATNSDSFFGAREVALFPPPGVIR